MLRYLRVSTFYKFLGPYSERVRRARMAEFIRIVDPKPGMRILDIGGTPEIWRYVDVPLKITLLNLEHDPRKKSASHHDYKFVTGDACEDGIPEGQYDLVFSNSVIEHVGDWERQSAFARNVTRGSSNYWVQTPAKWFPIEAHTGMPFWWFYPERLRAKLIRRWKNKLPAWTEMIEGTRLVELQALQSLFPGGDILVERSMGIVKSYTIYKCLPQMSSARI